MLRKNTKLVGRWSKCALQLRNCQGADGMTKGWSQDILDKKGQEEKSVQRNS